MYQIQEIEKKGTEAVKRLRIKKLQSGLPFMINSKDLPGNQCYMEYPNGSITLVTMAKYARDFKIIRELTQRDGLSIRDKYNLSY